MLSLFQFQDHRMFFSTYTTPGTHDAFQGVYSECPTPGQDQSQWVYAYFGYSREKQTAFSIYKTKTTNCERKLTVMHRVPKYFGLYQGKDGWHTPANAKYAHLYLAAGPGTFRDKDFDSEPGYVAGLAALVPKPLEWTEKSKELIRVDSTDDKALV